MTSPKVEEAVDQTLHYTRKNWPIILAIVACVFAGGGVSSRVSALEDKAKDAEENNLAIVRIEAEVSSMKEDFVEMKDKQETFRTEQRQFRRDIEAKIDSSNQLILQELRELRSRTTPGS